MRICHLTPTPTPYLFPLSSSAVACELSDPSTEARSPPYEVLETNDAATLIVDLPGCKKEDVDAQISEDSGSKTLTITALRKKPVRADGNARSPSSSPRGTSGSADGSSAASSSTDAADAAASHEAAKDTSQSSLSSFTEEKFKLSFRVGDDIDVSVIRGGLEDGVLTLVLPKLAPEPPAEPIDIPIDFNGPTTNDSGAGEGGRERQAAASTGRKQTSVDDAGGDPDTHISLS